MCMHGVRAATFVCEYTCTICACKVPAAKSLNYSKKANKCDTMCY